MKSSIAFALTTAFSGLTCSLAQTDRGNETIAGLGARKQEVLAAGADTLDLAIAMLETTNMGTDYPYGDDKDTDAANFGIFKQNWGMLRVCSSQFKGQTEAEWNDGAVLNEDLTADITARHECESFYGQETWFSGHRNGESGLQNPGTPDIQAYTEGVMWIQQQIDSDEKYLSDDTRFWADIVPI
ncbi:hypothetical protein FQN54_003178 [Arachnomyces sp. PD_36]|nr:hypothetical protein FQN54_003178 [Arachnomyces sp. PD_36]